MQVTSWNTLQNAGIPNPDPEHQLPGIGHLLHVQLNWTTRATCSNQRGSEVKVTSQSLRLDSSADGILATQVSLVHSMSALTECNYCLRQSHADHHCGLL